MAERIVEALRVRLNPKERARLAGRPTQDLEAYRSYLKGRHFLSRRTAASLRQAIEWLGLAVKADPAFAHAWAGLAEAWGLLPHYSPIAVPEAGVQARRAAGLALALDPGFVAAHNNLVNPYLCLERFEEALEEMEAASRLGHDGLPPDFVAEVRQRWASSGERGFWEAVLKGLRSRPEARGGDYFMVQAAARLGRIDEAFLKIGTLLIDRKSSALQIPFDPLLDPLHEDPRWEKVLERLELA